jgi:diadenosine tetraphosphatase ApaH/serine/threonine PP2A family protein phosphatase
MARYGLLADVHANLAALRAVLGRLERERLDGLVCAGDLVGYGPSPNECVELLSRRGVLCVAGNHDLIASGRLDDASAGRTARRSLVWTRAHLSDEVRDRLAALPLTAVTPDGVIVTHGAIDDPEARVVRPEGAVSAIAGLVARFPDACFLVVGNTHRPVAFDDQGRVPEGARGGTLRLAPGRRYLINPGSVGQSREYRAWARCAILDTAALELRFVTVRYDRGETSRASVAAGLPPGAEHRPPYARWLAPRRLPHRFGSALRRRLGRSVSGGG